jgi:hypothetical protein
LGAIGINPNATDSPVPVVPLQTLFGVLEQIRREIEHIFFNQTPVVAYSKAENSLLVDGSTEGDLHLTDLDGVIFTHTAPAHGDVVIDPDGTFTYTPGVSFTGSDSFDVTVSDADSGFHIHGLSGLLNLVTFGLVGDSGHTSSQHVTIGPERTVLVSGLNQPTDLQFLPDGRILIAE